MIDTPGKSAGIKVHAFFFSGKFNPLLRARLPAEAYSV